MLCAELATAGTGVYGKVRAQASAVNTSQALLNRVLHIMWWCTPEDQCCVPGAVLDPTLIHML
jgi:hypothetical protein